MTATPPPIDQSAAWQALTIHATAQADVTIADRFAADPDRAERLTVDGAGLHVDFSKNRVGAETIELLAALADTAGLANQREAMFAGEAINTTEDRPCCTPRCAARRDQS